VKHILVIILISITLTGFGLGLAYGFIGEWAKWMFFGLTSFFAILAGILVEEK
jgi:ABC-type multidrug transport system permease subunit